MFKFVCAILCLFTIVIIEMPNCAKAVPLSPCPRIFHYEYDGRRWIGVVKIYASVYNKYRGERMSLLLMLSMPSKVFIPSNMGAIEWFHTAMETYEHIAMDRPITYRVIFPEQSISPTLIQVIVNNVKICGNTGNTLGEASTTAKFRRYQVQKTVTLPARSVMTSPDDDDHETKDIGPRQETISLNAVNPMWGDIGWRSLPPSIAMQSLTSPPAPSPLPSVATNILQRQREESICGRQHDQFKVSQLTVGGDTIPRGTWPWMTAIYVKKLIGGVFFQCSGSLIANKLVLTAAHCFRINSAVSERKASDILLALGRYNLRDWTEDGTVLTDATSIHVHPDYLRNGRRFDSDIAIVRTKESIEYSKWIRPICLWTQLSQPRRTSTDAGTFIGWGQIAEDIENVPRMLSLPIVSNDECARSKESFR